MNPPVSPGKPEHASSADPQPTTTTDSEYGDLIDEDGGEATHLYDAQANTNALLDPTGNVLAQYKYYAFGNISAYSIDGAYWSTLDTIAWNTMTTDQWTDLTPGEGSIKMLAGGQKQYYLDQETSFYLLGAGASDNKAGTFLDSSTARRNNEDPIRQASGDVNLYPIVQSNPINRLDPSGHDSGIPDFPPPVLQTPDVEQTRLNIKAAIRYWDYAEKTASLPDYSSVLEKASAYWNAQRSHPPVASADGYAHKQEINAYWDQLDQVAYGDAAKKALHTQRDAFVAAQGAAYDKLVEEKKRQYLASEPTPRDAWANNQSWLQERTAYMERMFTNDPRKDPYNDEDLWFTRRVYFAMARPVGLGLWDVTYPVRHPVDTVGGLITFAWNSNNDPIGTNIQLGINLYGGMQQFGQMSYYDQSESMIRFGTSFLAGGELTKGIGPLAKAGSRFAGPLAKEARIYALANALKLSVEAAPPLRAEQVLIRPGVVLRTEEGLRFLKLSDSVSVADFDRLNSLDSKSATLRPGQAKAAAQLENVLGLMKPAAAGEKGDFLVSAGGNAGKTVDMMFTADTAKTGEMMNKYFDKNWPKVMKQIDEHLANNDVVPFDLRNLNSAAKTRVLDYLKALAPELRRRALILE